MLAMKASRRTASYGSSGGVYAYRTASDTRWRCAFRRSDGSLTSKRGFQSKRAASEAHRRLTEKVERGDLRHNKESFGQFWARWLQRRKAYVEGGTWGAYQRGLPQPARPGSRRL